MKTKSGLILLFSILSISFTQAGCYQKFCWKNEDEMLIAAEQQFRDDINNGSHKHELTPKNLCKYHISSIAYGFSIVESSKGNSKLVEQTNNRFSIKKGSGLFQYKREPEMGFLKGSKYLKYDNEFFATLDFMYLFKYAYSCNTSLLSVARYKTGSIKGDANTKRYHSNLIFAIQSFEKKYFGKGENVYSYNLANKTYLALNKKVAPKTGEKDETTKKILGKLNPKNKYDNAIKKVLLSNIDKNKKKTLTQKILSAKKTNNKIDNNKKLATNSTNSIPKINENAKFKFSEQKLQQLYSLLRQRNYITPLLLISNDNSTIKEYKPEIEIAQTVLDKDFLKLISINFVLRFYKMIL